MGSYLDLWKGRMRLARPGNALMAGIGVLVGIGFAIQPWSTSIDGGLATPAIAGFLAALFITAFGNVLNDLHDVEIDRTAHPDRPLPSGAIQIADAKAWAILLLGLGLLEAWVAAGKTLVAFAAVNAGLLWFYESMAKKRGLIGNLLVAALVGSTFAFGAYAVSGMTGVETVMPIVLMASLATLARELIKDVQDMAADQGHRKTLAHVTPRGAKILAKVSLAIAMGYVAAIAYDTPWSAPGWTLMAIGDGLFVWGLVMSWTNPGRSQQLLKWGMLVMLAMFLVEAA